MNNVYSDKERNAIANTIWQQLGSQRFSFVTGCKPVVYGESNGKVYLLMSVGSNCHNINLFEVAYNEGSDLYELRFIRKQDNNAHVVALYKEVYADMMHTYFSKETGMTVTMPKIEEPCQRLSA